MLHIRSFTGSQYTSSVEMLLDRFGQSNKICKKSWENVDMQVSTLKVLWGTSRINLSRTSLKRQIGTSHGHHFRTFPGRQIGTSPGFQIRTSPGRSNRIFRGLPGDVGGERPREVLGTNICRLGKHLSIIGRAKKADR